MVKASGRDLRVMSSSPVPQKCRGVMNVRSVESSSVLCCQCQLRETSSFNVTRHDAGRQRAVCSSSLEESILNVVAVRPESSTGAVAHRLSVSHQTVCRVLNKNLLNLFRFQRVQALNPAGYLLRLPVCRTAMLENNPHLTSREIAEELCIHHTTIGDHIKSLGKGPVYYELLKQGKTINMDLYCNQLDKLNAAIKKASISITKRNSVPP
ncbi:hypothetical protein TNCV_575321 [Trichonephila clavipes]|nr:hypothetical protein TNCV_575321 [Trichonephila clavipes]